MDCTKAEVTNYFPTGNKPLAKKDMVRERVIRILYSKFLLPQKK